MIARLPAFLSGHAALSFGALTLLMEIGVAVAAPVLYPGDPFDMVGAPMLRPFVDPAFPLGTDLLGRDLAAGLVHGARTSLIVALFASALSIALGGAVGVVAGYAGGWVDHLAMRICELFQTIPHLLLALFVVAIWGATLETIVVALASTAWPSVARLARAETLLLRELDFVGAAVAMGASDLRIVLTHIVPNAMPQVLASASILGATAILAESGLAFLGLGDPNRMSWGSMIGGGREAVRSAYHLVLIPGAAVLVTVLALNLVGDGLTALSRPRSRR
ncbi:MAG: ABC transporter permease [Methylocystaceae bacterium]|nr:MAG: ABC transporter permease [Methylocystaceae bacterium]